MEMCNYYKCSCYLYLFEIKDNTNMSIFHPDPLKAAVGNLNLKK